MRRTFFGDLLFRLLRAPLLLSASLLISMEASAEPRETAVDHIALPLFSISQDANVGMDREQFRRKLQTDIASQLKKKTYLEIKTMDRIAPVNLKAATVRRAARGVGVDGVLVGEVRPGQLRMQMLSGVGGRSLVRWILPFPQKMNGRSYRKLVAEVVEAVVEAIPYRGYVTDTRGEMVKLNLGSNDAIKQGQTLKLFEFAGDQPNFSSEQQYVGEVEVTKVSGQNSIARQVDGHEVPAFSKVAFSQDFVQRLSAKNHVDDGNWVSVGFDVFSIDTTFQEDNELAGRQIDLAFSPFLAVAGGAGDIEVELVYGKAENDSNAVTFAFLTAQYVLKAWGDQLKGWTLAAGITGRQFKSTAKEETEDTEEDTDSVGTLENINGLHPFLDLRWSWVPRNRTKLYAGGRLLYFLSETGGEITNALSSGGVNLYGGIRIDMTSEFGIETGVRAQLASVALKNDFNFTESQLTLFWRSIILF